MLTAYKKEDLSLAAEFFFDVFSNEPFCYEFLTKEKAGAYLEDIEKTPCFHGFRYSDGSNCLGFCFGNIYGYFSEPYYEIKEIFVNPRLQRNGTGSAMLLKIESYLRTKGVRLITLNTSKNIPAYNFYLKNNYDTADDNVHFYKNL